MKYTALGKEVLHNGAHFADAVDPGAATLIADVLNRRHETRYTPLAFAIVEPLQGVFTGPAPCRAYQCSDQMLCGCGLAWDVNDDSPCRHFKGVNT